MSLKYCITLHICAHNWYFWIRHRLKVWHFWTKNRRYRAVRVWITGALTAENPEFGSISWAYKYPHTGRYGTFATRCMHEYVLLTSITNYDRWSVTATPIIELRISATCCEMNHAIAENRSNSYYCLPTDPPAWPYEDPPAAVRAPVDVRVFTNIRIQ